MQSHVVADYGEKIWCNTSYNQKEVTEEESLWVAPVGDGKVQGEGMLLSESTLNTEYHRVVLL